MNYKKGDLVEHERYGEGIVMRASLTAYEILFERGGKMSFSKPAQGIELIEAFEEQESKDSNGLNLEEITQVIENVLNKYNGLQHIVELGDKWQGGTLIVQPENKEMKAKEIPIEAFFHKIVMVRDRLRVLEQNINSHNKLTDEDKVNMQQYITRIYGSLTTFNILFKNREDYFEGVSGKE